MFNLGAPTETRQTIILATAAGDVEQEEMRSRDLYEGNGASECLSASERTVIFIISSEGFQTAALKRREEMMSCCSRKTEDRSLTLHL